MLFDIKFSNISSVPNIKEFVMKLIDDTPLKYNYNMINNTNYHYYMHKENMLYLSITSDYKKRNDNSQKPYPDIKLMKNIRELTLESSQYKKSTLLSIFKTFDKLEKIEIDECLSKQIYKCLTTNNIILNYLTNYQSNSVKNIPFNLMPKLSNLKINAYKDNDCLPYDIMHKLRKLKWEKYILNDTDISHLYNLEKFSGQINIQNNCFDKMINLKKIKLYNSELNIKENVFEKTTKIEKIICVHCDINIAMINGLKKLSNLKNLELINCKLINCKCDKKIYIDKIPDKLETLIIEHKFNYKSKSKSLTSTTPIIKYKSDILKKLTILDNSSSILIGGNQLEKIKISCNSSDYYSYIEPCPKLKLLDINNYIIDNNDFINQKNIENLILHNVRININQTSLFYGMNSVKKLYIDDCSIYNSHIMYEIGANKNDFINLQNLETLEISYSIDQKNKNIYVNNLKKLKNLIIKSESNIYITNLPILETLKVDSKNIIDLNVPNLKKLNISYYVIPKNFFKNLNNLEILIIGKLKNSKIISNLSKLKVLKIDYCMITYDEHFKNFTQLSDLQIDVNIKQSILSTAMFDNIPNLKNLNINIPKLQKYAQNKYHLK